MVGEIDVLFYFEGQFIYFEVVYKFYFFDIFEKYEIFLGVWIGLN